MRQAAAARTPSRRTSWAGSAACSRPGTAALPPTHPATRSPTSAASCHTRDSSLDAADPGPSSVAVVIRAAILDLNCDGEWRIGDITDEYKVGTEAFACHNVQIYRGQAKEQEYGLKA